MSKFYGILKIDIKRAFFSPLFFIVALLMSVNLFFGILDDIRTSSSDVLYYYQLGTFQNLNIELLLCVLPYATSFCMDWNNKFIRPLAIRSSQKYYAVSKVISVAVSGCCALIFGQLIFIILLSFKYKLVDPAGVSFQSYTNGSAGSFSQLLLNGQYWFFFIVMIVIKSLSGAVFATLSLWISTKVTNVFVTLAAPIVCYNIINFSSSIFKIPGWLRINYIYKGTIQVGGSITNFCMYYYSQS